MPAIPPGKNHGRKDLKPLKFGEYSMGDKKVNPRLGISTAKATARPGKDRFDMGAQISSSAVKAPTSLEKSKMGDFSVKPRAAKNYAPDKAPRRKPVTGVSSGSIDKPNNKSAQKSRDELGAFYLNATSGMDIFSRPKKKK